MIVSEKSAGIQSEQLNHKNNSEDRAAMGTALKHSDSFSLVKWYLDCVTDEGEVAIVYGTEISWHGICTSVNSVLGGSEDRVETRTSISPFEITQAGKRIAIEVPKQGVAGEWDADSAACERVVYETDAGKVKWNCIQPRSRVRLRLDDGELSGLGYAECVTLTMAPWKLPLRELRWGRFVSPRNWMVWVDWKGSHETSFAFVDGEECASPAISDAGVTAAGAKLRIEDGFVLRSGRIGSTILPRVPGLAKLLPHSLFNIEERKWCSRGEMQTNDHCSSGWVIHEVVHWNV